jgi:hypothetical protein
VGAARGMLQRQVVRAGYIDGTTAFVICSEVILGRIRMMTTSTKTFLMAAVLSALATSAFAQAAAPTPWELKPDTGYAYDKEGKTFIYKMGTNNAGLLLKGAKKVPKGTLFFMGHNGQLYMRSAPYLEGDGKFMFGSN